MINILLTREEAMLNEEVNREEERRDEIQKLNEEVFEEEQKQAYDCPHRHHMNHYLCDGCSITAACCSIPDEY